MKDYDIEIFYNLLGNNKFDELLDLEKRHRNKIKEDLAAKNIFDTYLIPTILSYVKNSNDDLTSSLILKRVFNTFIQHRNITYNIPNESFNELVSQYINILKLVNKFSLAYTISIKFNNLKIANDFINEYEKSNPKEINHSNSENIRLSVNTNIKEENKTIKLFKSKQEYEFFYSITDYYPNYFTYPNVALSCIVSFDDIKNELSQNEISYFFKAIIDCVVFKNDNDNFIPMFFFELDSIFHDETKQEKNDRIKDKILSLSGQKLYRIRTKDNSNLKRDELKILIEEELSK